MKNLRTWIIVFISVIVFSIASFFLPIFEIEREMISLVLSVTSILFGLLAAFFISELWTRYTEIRSLMGETGGKKRMLAYLHPMLSGNKKFKTEFRKSFYKYLIFIIGTPIHLAHKVEPVFDDLMNTLKLVKIGKQKDVEIFNNILTLLQGVAETEQKIEILGKERLFPAEWFLMFLLSLIIVICTFLIRSGSLFSNIFAIIFPVIIILALTIIDDLNELRWNAGIILVEPDEKSLDVMGFPRFYPMAWMKTRGIRPPEGIKYTTEYDLKGKLKKEFFEAYGEVYPEKEK